MIHLEQPITARLVNKQLKARFILEGVKTSHEHAVIALLATTEFTCDDIIVFRVRTYENTSISMHYFETNPSISKVEKISNISKWIRNDQFFFGIGIREFDLQRRYGYRCQSVICRVETWPEREQSGILNNIWSSRVIRISRCKSAGLSVPYTFSPVFYFFLSRDFRIFEKQTCSKTSAAIRCSPDVNLSHACVLVLRWITSEETLCSHIIKHAHTEGAVLDIVTHRCANFENDE